MINLSLSGVLLAGAEDLQVGESIQVSLDGLGPLPGTIVRKVGSRAGIRFENMPEANRDQLIVYLYTSGFSNQVQEIDPFRVLWQLLKGAILGPTKVAQYPETIESLGRQLHFRPCGESATIATTGSIGFSEGAPEQRNTARQPQANRQTPEPRPLAAIHGRETR